MVSFSSYSSPRVSFAVSVFSRILFLITSSTLADDRDSLVSNLPWIFEKSFPFVLVMLSISC